MRLSRRSEYGLRALVDLIRNDGNGPVALAVLAQRNNLPAKFLEQIMATLKHGGIVRTTLGAHGGYAMDADPFDGHDRPGRPPAGRRAGAAPMRVVAVLRTPFVPRRGDLPAARREIDVRDAMLEILDQETIAQMAARQGHASIDPRGIHADALAGRRP
jgi:Rrf2 family cysteine metabolism transcriptional repressor